MKQLVTTFLFFITLTYGVFAQSLDTGIKFYEEQNYGRALRIFEDLDSPTAQLFTGKSYFALNNYLKAKHYLNKVGKETGEIYTEAQYTKALADFQLKNYASSLDILHEVKDFSRKPSITRAANSFYRDLLDYLTLSQRYQAFRASRYDTVRFDLVEAGVGTLELSSARALFNAYKQSATGPYPANYASVEALLKDSVAYSQRYNPNIYPKAPKGIAYNIGVALPEFSIESPEFEISQHIYFGIQQAVENFNSQNSDAKAFLSYQNTKAQAHTAAGVANELAWNHNVDAIVGPLFSEVAVEMSKYAEKYQTPMLTPLANSDSLNIDLSYTFQLNPTFSVQGKKMAQFAINRLGYDTLAVIAERGSLGEPSAMAFLDESRKLGAEVLFYFVEDLKSQGYDISEYVQHFDPAYDTLTNYGIDAVYAPFTGSIAETLISSLLTNLEAMNTGITILGSEEWETVQLERRGVSRNAIYYSKTFERQPGNTAITEFESAFRLRFNREPNRFAFIGYDAANAVLETLKKVKNPANLKEGLKNLNNYRGLITDISFRDSHINQEVKIKQLTQN